VRIAHDAECCRSFRPGDVDAVLDQRYPNSAPLCAGIDEQSVQLGVAVRPPQQGSKSKDGAVSLGHEYRPGGNLIERQLDGFRVGQQGFAVTGVSQGRAKLQSFKLLLLRDKRKTDPRAAHKLTV